MKSYRILALMQLMSAAMVVSIPTATFAMDIVPSDTAKKGVDSADESGCSRCWSGCGTCWSNFWPCCKKCCQIAEEDAVILAEDAVAAFQAFEKFTQEHPAAYHFLLDLAEGKSVEEAALEEFKSTFSNLDMLTNDGQIKPTLVEFAKSFAQKQKQK